MSGCAAAVNQGGADQKAEGKPVNFFMRQKKEEKTGGLIGQWA